MALEPQDTIIERNACTFQRLAQRRRGFNRGERQRADEQRCQQQQMGSGAEPGDAGLDRQDAEDQHRDIERQHQQ
jgi:hypothetical protein